MIGRLGFNCGCGHARAQWRALAGNWKQSRIPVEGRGIRRGHGRSAAAEMKERGVEGGGRLILG